MYKQMFKEMITTLFSGVFCGLMLTGCSSAPDEARPKSSDSLPSHYVANGFVPLDEFCRAKLIHVVAHTNKSVVLNGSCYIEDNSTNPVINIILKRALKNHNLQIAHDKNSANYILNVSLDQQYVRRRTYTTLKLVFTENNKDNSVIWTGVASVSGRGSYHINQYAASMTGAIMYNFNQFATTNINRRTLQSYYQRLASVED